MPNKKTKEEVIQKYPQYFNSQYYNYDTLANADDLDALFNVLYNRRNVHGKSAIITANTIVANPDFNLIRKSGFENYFFEDFVDTLSRYYSNNVFDYWKTGIRNKVFLPQLHGREHVDIHRWMEELRKGNEMYMEIFKRNFYAVDYHQKTSKKNLTTSLDYNNYDEASDKANNIREGCKIFEKIFGYKSKSFIAPSYTWYSLIENVLKNEGVKYLQGIQKQKKPIIGSNEYEYKRNFLGDKNSFGQYYLIRNVFFEPTLQNKSHNAILSNCLFRINAAFNFHKPAILSSHRLNFIGTLEIDNRDRNLKLLDLLLKEIIKRWPTVEFMTSAQLGIIIESKDKF